MDFIIDNSLQGDGSDLPTNNSNYFNFVYNNVFLINTSNSSNYTRLTSNILDTKINNNNLTKLVMMF